MNESRWPVPERRGDENEDVYFDLTNGVREVAGFDIKPDPRGDDERRFHAILDAAANGLRPSDDDQSGTPRRCTRSRLCGHPSYVQRSPETDW